MGSAFIRKRPNGSFQVIVDRGIIPETGRRARDYFTAQTEYEANKIRIRELCKLQTDTCIVPNDITFAELYEIWMQDYVAHNCQETTMIEYKRVCEKYIIPSLGKFKVRDIKTSHIQMYYKKLMDNVGLSANTISKHHANISSCLNYAIRPLKLIEHNESEECILPKETHYEPTVYSVRLVKELLESLKRDEIEVPIKIALYLGLRRSEIIGLKWANINMEERYIKIRNVIVRANTTTVEKELLKGDSSKRNLYIPDDLYETLVFQKQRQQFLVNSRKDYIISDYVCTKDDGRRYDPNLSKQFTRFLKRNGFPHIRLHDLRHTLISILYESGAPLKGISQVAGHADPAFTEKTYVTLHKDNNKDIAVMYNNILNK